jgi:hypothetical protein
MDALTAAFDMPFSLTLNSKELFEIKWILELLCIMFSNSRWRNSGFQPHCWREYDNGTA